MGNWYEDRLALPQQAKEHPEDKQVRPDEPESICYMTQNSIVQLARIQRRPAWNTRGTIISDTFTVLSIEMAEFTTL